MAKKILFRADGNSETGLGHLYRLFSLVEIVKDSFEYEFLTMETSTISIIPNEFIQKTLPNSIKIEDEPEWLEKEYLPQEHLVIADGYQFTSSYQKAIKAKGFQLIFIDDLANEHMFADVVINHSPYINSGHYKKEDYSRLALGTQYALLRPLFLEQAKKSRSLGKIDRGFVCFGGADPLDLTHRAVEALLRIKTFKKIKVVLGGAYKHESIHSLVEKNPNTLELFRNLKEKDLLSEMSQCNFAIVPASTILYELCCVKMPILSGYYVNNQKLIYNGFLEQKAIFGGGDFTQYQTSDFFLKSKAILTAKNMNECVQNQTMMFDDEIAERHLNLIKSLCQP